MNLISFHLNFRKLGDDENTTFLIGSEEFRYLQFSADNNVR